MTRSTNVDTRTGRGGRLSTLRRSYDLRLFGAVGDGVTNDTPAVQAAAAAVSATGGTLIIPEGHTYSITAPIAITAPARITGGGTLDQATPGVSALQLRANDITVEGLTVTGPGNTATVFGWDRNGIDAVGTLAQPLSGISLSDVTAVGFSGNGILIEWVDGFELDRFHVESIKYAGVACLQARNGSVTAGRVIGNTIGLPGNANAYGVFCSMRGNAGDWRAENIIVTAVHVSDFPSWEGLDTHGGRNIVFQGCLVERCKRGIALIRAPLLDGTRIPPVDCAAIGNTLDSGTDDGTARFDGINVAGPTDGTGAPIAYATGCRVVGNTIRRYGLDEANRINGGIVVNTTRGLVIADNHLIECSPNGIAINGTSHGLVVAGNAIVDPHSTIASSCAAIRIPAGPVDGVFTGNSLVRGALTGPGHIAEYGVHVPNTVTGVSVDVSGNDFRAAVIVETNDVLNTLIHRAVTRQVTRATPTTAQRGALSLLAGGVSGSGDSVAIAAVDIYGASRWLDVVNPPVERVTFSLSAEAAIPTGVWTQISWTSIVFQAEFPTALTVPAAGLTVPFAGHWHLDVAANFRVAATGLRGVRVLVNGAIIDEAVIAASSTQRCTPRLSRDWSFSTGAVVTVEAFQDSGADVNLAVTRSVFCARRVGLI